MTVWCRVRDKTTGHCFDVPLGRLEYLLEIDAVQEIPDARHESREPRAPEHADSPPTADEPADEPADQEENAG
jgi:hypothetical protein